MAVNKEKIEELRKQEAEDLAKILSQKYQLPYLDLTRITIDLDSLKIVPEKTARESRLAVFQSVGKKLQVAVRNPDIPSTREILEELKRTGYTAQLFIVSENSLQKAWSRYKEVPEFTEISKGLIEISEEKIDNFLVKIKNTADLKTALETLANSNQARKISEMLEAILGGALSLEASDVHIEPQEETARLRTRLDGVLQDVVFFDKKTYSLILSRIKLISELKLNIHDKAQDGRFTIRAQTNDIEVRTSILPGPFGESVVLRILNPKTIALAFADLGLHPVLLEIMEKEIDRPNGMILTTGPTGSGKTTTLYAFVKKIYSPATKIITIEDPIEYHLAGISQTQVKEEKGYDFAKGLRSILRQDPDIILVGEIRDLETAETAMHAALTGHLVFSTLHTNNAAGTVPRLIDLGVKPNIIAPAINVAMAQRLVRKLCAQCKQKDLPTAEEKSTIEKILKDLPKNIAQPDLSNLSIFRPKGCGHCNATGYQGRVGVFEAILINDEIEKLILKTPSENEITKAAKKQNIPTIEQDAILKAISGITSLEEIKRILGVF